MNAGSHAVGLRWVRTLVQFARAKPLGAVGLGVLVLMLMVAALGPLISPHDPEKSFVGFRLAKPSARFLLGTDQIGRDILSRIILGARTSLLMGSLVVVVGVGLGSVFAVLSVHFGGKFDLFAQRLIDVLGAFPGLILALALMAALGRSMSNVVVALMLVSLPSVTRTVRSAALAIKEEQYIESATAIGAGHARIAFRHMLPNCVAPVIVLASATLGWAIVVEASLSFLGMGLPPNVPTWGGMLSGAIQQYARTAPWLVVFPGVALSITVMAINLLGDALRDVLDPRLHGG